MSWTCLRLALFSVCLFASSFTIWRAETGLRNNNQRKMIGWLSATIILGGIFIGGQGMEYWHLFKSGVDREYESFRDDLLYPDWLSWLARLCRPDRAACSAGIGAGGRLEEAAVAGARCRRALLALRRCGLGLCVVCGLHPASTPMNTEHFLLSAWTWNPGGSHCFRGRACCLSLCFSHGAAGLAGSFLRSLFSYSLSLHRLNALADGYLFSAHMLQHILLLLIVPGLLLLSLPRSFSLAWRPRILSHPLVGWIAGVGAMWFWHWPTLCNAAVTSRSVYALQTVSLLVLGTLFWSQIIAPREEERLSPPGAVLYLFSACVTCSALGIILTFSPITVCSIYAMPGVTGSECGKRFDPVGDSLRKRISRSADSSCGCRCVSSISARSLRKSRAGSGTAPAAPPATQRL